VIPSLMFIVSALLYLVSAYGIYKATSTCETNSYSSPLTKSRKATIVQESLHDKESEKLQGNLQVSESCVIVVNTPAKHRKQ